MSRTNTDFAQRRDQLIKKALDLFIQKGYEQTTIIELQRAFGLTKGGMYHYFSSKEEILDAVIEKGLSISANELRRRIMEVPLEERLIYLLSDNEFDNFGEKMVRYAWSGESSFVAFKLQAYRLKISVPLVAEILRQYVDSGFYTCAYPDIMAEILMQITTSLVKLLIPPASDIEKFNQGLEELLMLWKDCMKPPEEHLVQLSAFAGTLPEYIRNMYS